METSPRRRHQPLWTQSVDDLNINGQLNLDYSSDIHLSHNAYANPNDEESRESIVIYGHGPGRRAGHTATAVNRHIYIFGGSCGSDYLNDFFVLDTGECSIQE